MTDAVVEEMPYEYLLSIWARAKQIGEGIPDRVGQKYLELAQAATAVMDATYDRQRDYEKEAEG